MRPEPDADALLAAWRAQGADRIDPLRFHHIAALRRRAHGLDGDARRRLDARIADLLRAYAARVTDTAGDRARKDDDANGTAPTQHRRTPGPLAALTAALAATSTTADHAPMQAAADRPEATMPPAPDALDDLRRIWSEVRSRSQLRRSLAHSADDAGPLNSARIVQRSLGLMRDCAPGYLQRFLDYADTLSWLEQMQAAASPGGDTPAVGGKPRPRKPRRRRDPPTV